MSGPLLNTDFDRSKFSDEAYGAVGRLLTLASEFEGHCHALAALLGVKRAVNRRRQNRGRQGGDIQNRRRQSRRRQDRRRQDSSDCGMNTEEMIRLGEAILSNPLNANIKAIFENSEPTPEDVRGAFHDARKARNRVAHGITKEIRHDIESDNGRVCLLEALQKETAIIAKANYFAAILAAVASKEEYPRVRHLERYVADAQSWVIEMFD